ncbi:MAG: efflux RND transporter periplasmic adaptor subunit [Rhizobiales bacterium]|nr:efflux RND transporter periplasmic adaptor subunit [Hyphomicrobiales bacterium]NRB13258.1 efflux RND transporter periplasmic adaptor subunit [Hyphomicrobiales bacterium]
MRALKSYGIAAILILSGAFWLSTGLYVEGGNGPVDGELTVVEALEKDGGPLTDMVAATGLGRTLHQVDETNDPALSIRARSDAAKQGDGVKQSVRTGKFIVQPMPLEVTLRGYTAAKASVKATAQTSDTVRSVDVREGQNVKIGTLICTLDDGTRLASVEQAKAAVSQAEASLKQAQLSYKTNQALLKKKLVSENSAEGKIATLRSAEANVQAAKVALRNREVELENTKIKAPVAGVIQRPLAEVGDQMSRGGSCATIVQLDPMVFVGSVPQARIDLARLGLTAKITTINNKTAVGKVSFVSVSSDPATRSFAIEIEFPNVGGVILDGLTAEAEVNLGNIPAHFIPQSVMTLDNDGNLGVRAVNDNVVAFHSISILKDTNEGAWVTGLPVSVDIIILGQEYVTAGQIVDAVAQSDIAAQDEVK